MKCFLSIACLIVGLCFGAVGGWYAGSFVQLQKEFTYRNAVFTAMSQDDRERVMKPLPVKRR